MEAVPLPPPSSTPATMQTNYSRPSFRQRMPEDSSLPLRNVETLPLAQSDFLLRLLRLKGIWCTNATSWVFYKR